MMASRVVDGVVHPRTQDEEATDESKEIGGSNAESLQGDHGGETPPDLGEVVGLL